jgi:hypothetical protein
MSVYIVLFYVVYVCCCPKKWLQTPIALKQQDSKWLQQQPLSKPIGKTWRKKRQNDSRKKE